MNPKRLLAAIFCLAAAALWHFVGVIVAITFSVVVLMYAARTRVVENDAARKDVMGSAVPESGKTDTFDCELYKYAGITDERADCRFDW